MTYDVVLAESIRIESRVVSFTKPNGIERTLIVLRI